MPRKRRWKARNAAPRVVDRDSRACAARATRRIRRRIALGRRGQGRTRPPPVARHGNRAPGSRLARRRHVGVRDHLARGMSSRAHRSASSRISASICAAGNRCAVVVQLDADRGGIDVGDRAPAARARVPGTAVLGDELVDAPIAADQVVRADRAAGIAGAQGEQALRDRSCSVAWMTIRIGRRGLWLGDGTQRAIGLRCGACEHADNTASSNRTKAMRMPALQRQQSGIASRDRAWRIQTRMARLPGPFDAARERARSDRVVHRVFERVRKGCLRGTAAHPCRTPAALRRAGHPPRQIV